MNAKNIKLTIYDDEIINKTVGVKGLKKAIENLSKRGWVAFTVKRKVGKDTYKTLYIYDYEKGLESVHNGIEYEDGGWQTFAAVEFKNIPEGKPASTGQPKRFVWDPERRCIVGVY